MTTTARNDGATEDEDPADDAAAGGPAVAVEAAAMLDEAAEEMDRTGRHDVAESHRAHAQELRLLLLTLEPRSPAPPTSRG